MRRLIYCVAAVLIALSSSARADGDKLARAKAHYETGDGLFKLGRYPEAIQEFSAGYSLLPKPHFLLDLGQAYRALGDHAHAAEMYEKFLADTTPDDPLRDKVTHLLDEERYRGRHAVTPPPRRIEPTPSPVTPVVPAIALAAPAPVERPGFARRNWWIFPVLAVVIVGAALAVYFATRPAVDCGSATLGCIDPSH